MTTQPDFRRVPDEAVRFSPREREVVDLVARGLTNQEIAVRLYLGANTVKTYLRGAYRKMGATSRATALLWIIEHDLHPTLGPRDRARSLSPVPDRD
jgi:two-component system, NarL family, response regulator LiaR